MEELDTFDYGISWVAARIPAIDNFNTWSGNMFMLADNGINKTVFSSGITSGTIPDQSKFVQGNYTAGENVVCGDIDVCQLSFYYMDCIDFTDPKKPVSFFVPVN